MLTACRISHRLFRQESLGIEPGGVAKSLIDEGPFEGRKQFRVELAIFGEHADREVVAPRHHALRKSGDFALDFTLSALWVRMKSIVSIQPATNAADSLGQPRIERIGADEIVVLGRGHLR